MRSISAKTAENQDFSETALPGMLVILAGDPAPLSGSASAPFQLPCYYLNQQGSSPKIPGWIKAVSCPCRKDISLTRPGTDIEKLFSDKNGIYCLDWLDPDFQLPSFGKKRKIILFDNTNRLLCFEDGDFVAAIEVCPVESVKDLKLCRKKANAGAAPLCLYVETANPALEQVFTEIRLMASSGKIASYELFSDKMQKNKKCAYEIFTLPIPDSPLKRSRRGRVAGEEFISRRDLIADMTGIVELNEADVRYIFRTGFLAAVDIGEKRVLENPQRGAYLRNGKMKYYFQRESSFSFEGDNVRGLRECLVFNGQNSTGRGRIITDYYLCGDYRGLFVSTFIQYPKAEFEFYDSYNVWETELGIVPQGTEIGVQRKINGKDAPRKIITEAGVYHFPADIIYIEAGKYAAGIQILKKRGTEAEIFSLVVQQYRKSRLKISLSMLGTYSTVHNSEYHRFSESLSFCLFPGKPSDFSDIPEEARKEAYAARSWKKI